MFGRNRARRRVEALERQLATVSQQIDEAEDRRTRFEKSLKAEFLVASAAHDAAMDALRGELRKQDDQRGRLDEELAGIAASLSGSREGQGEQIAMMRQIVGKRVERSADPGLPEQVARDGDELPQWHSQAIKALHVAIERLSRRIELDAEEGARTTAALVERIEQSGRSGAFSLDLGAGGSGVRL